MRVARNLTHIKKPQMIDTRYRKNQIEKKNDTRSHEHSIGGYESLSAVSQNIFGRLKKAIPDSHPQLKK